MGRWSIGTGSLGRRGALSAAIDGTNIAESKLAKEVRFRELPTSRTKYVSLRPSRSALMTYMAIQSIGPRYQVVFSTTSLLSRNPRREDATRSSELRGEALDNRRFTSAIQRSLVSGTADSIVGRRYSGRRSAMSQNCASASSIIDLRCAIRDGLKQSSPEECSQRPGAPNAAVDNGTCLLDLEDFKIVNETSTQRSGDLVLCETRSR